MRKTIKFFKTWWRQILVALFILTATMVIWQSRTENEYDMKKSVVIVECKSWYEVDVNGKAKMFFSTIDNDSTLNNISAHRDSTICTRYTVGCWINRLAAAPSCFGRIVSVDTTSSKTIEKGAHEIMAKNGKVLREMLVRLKAEAAELRYYLRVHGVRDEGYNDVAKLATAIAAKTDTVKTLINIINKMDSNENIIKIRPVKKFKVYYRDFFNHLRTKTCLLNNRRYDCILLQTTDHSTPIGVRPQSIMPWEVTQKYNMLAVGFGGLNVTSFAKTTSDATIVPGWTDLKKVDLPDIIACDGAPIYSLYGRFIGIKCKGKFIKRGQLKELFEEK